MIPKSINNLIKKKKKEARAHKELISLRCNICDLKIYEHAIPIKAKAIKKEFYRQHNHKTNLIMKIRILLKGGEIPWIKPI